jgi:hypothetical protein
MINSDFETNPGRAGHMKRKDIYFTGLVFLAIVLAGAMPVFASDGNSSMMCDEGVVNVGDTDVDVWSACGEPESQSMNQWVYDFGPSQPIYIVTFKDGKVVSIQQSDRSD